MKAKKRVSKKAKPVKPFNLQAKVKNILGKMRKQKMKGFSGKEGEGLIG